MTLGVVGELGLEAGPDGGRLLVLAAPLVEPAERLEDLERIVARRLAGQGPLEGLGRRAGLADEHERLAQVEGGQRVVGAEPLGLAERRHRRRVAAPLGLEEADQERRQPVVRVLRGPVAIRPDQLVERPPLDVISVDAVERRPPARFAFEDAQEPLHHAPIAILIRRFERRAPGRAEGRWSPGSGGRSRASQG